MSDFKVKYESQKKAPEEKAVNAIFNWTKRHKGWVALIILGILVAGYYTAGWVTSIFIVLLLILLIIFGKNIYDLIEWVLQAKGEQRDKRIIACMLIGVGLFGVYALVKWVILPTSVGQSISNFIWRSF